ncbi:hypothetical protein EV426DRAFT_625652 [Tirmania nivea]|nr:hypothetical protein EV426DRAFT_625652 [Tirmania nivea]
MSTAHIVALPGFVSIIRIVQLVLTLVILGLIGNTLNGFTGGTGITLGVEPLAFMIFCCVWTLLVNAYLLATPIFLPAAYNMWAHLGLEAIAWIFWLSGWAATASWASLWSAYSEYSGKIYSYWATAAAGAAMGAIMWILYTVTLVFFCLRLHAHRADPNNAHLSGLGLAEKGGETHPMGAVQQHQQQVVYSPSESAPTPVQTYVATPPPQQWQQSPPPQGQQGQY